MIDREIPNPSFISFIKAATSTPLIWVTGGQHYSKSLDAFGAIFYQSDDLLEQCIKENKCKSTRFYHPLLHHCIYCGNINAVKILLKNKKIDVNEVERIRGWTALHESVYFGQNKIAELLLSDKKCDIWKKSFDGELCLDVLDGMRFRTVKCETLIKKFQSETKNILCETVIYLPNELHNIIVFYLYS